MKYQPKDYEVRIRWSPDEGDECFIATVVDWPGIAAHGDTIEAASHEIMAALQLSLEAYEAWGKEAPAPRRAMALA